MGYVLRGPTGLQILLTQQQEDEKLMLI